MALHCFWPFRRTSPGDESTLRAKDVLGQEVTEFQEYLRICLLGVRLESKLDISGSPVPVWRPNRVSLSLLFSSKLPVSDFFLGVQEVPGSNPGVPTSCFKGLASSHKGFGVQLESKLVLIPTPFHW